MNTNKEYYEHHLKESLIALEESIIHVRTAIINLAMFGEMAAINALFKEDEILEFKYGDFRNLNDQNVKLLYEICDFLEDKKVQLEQINNIKKSDLNNNDDELPF